MSRSGTPLHNNSYSRTELQILFKQKDVELKNAKALVEERTRALVEVQLKLDAANAAAKALQQELLDGKKEIYNVRAEAKQFADDVATRLRDSANKVRDSEDKVAAIESKNRQLENHLVRQSKESQDIRAAYEASIAEREGQIKALGDKMDYQAEQIETLERLLRERASLLTEVKEKMTRLEADKEEGERAMRELLVKHKMLRDDKAVVEATLARTEDALDATRRDVADVKQALEVSYQEREAAAVEARNRLGAAERDAERKLVEAEARSQEAERSWRSKVLDVEAAWEARVRETVRDMERRAEQGRAELEHAWEMKLSKFDADWQCRLRDAEEAAVKERRAAEAERAALLERASSEREALERLWSAKLHDLESVWSGKLEQLQARWATERVKLEDAAAGQRDQLEASWRLRMEEAKAAAHKHAIEVERGWSERMEDSVRRWQAEREELEALWAKRVANEREQAAATVEALKAEMESKLSDIHGRMQDMAANDAVREKARAELRRQVEALQEQTQTEYRKRVELESAVRSTAGALKQELFQKKQEILDLEAEVRRTQRRPAAAVTSPVPGYVAAASPRAAAAGTLSPRRIGASPARLSAAGARLSSAGSGLLSPRAGGGISPGEQFLSTYAAARTSSSGGFASPKRLSTGTTYGEAATASKYSTARLITALASADVDAELRGLQAARDDLRTQDTLAKMTTARMSSRFADATAELDTWRTPAAGRTPY